VFIFLLQLRETAFGHPEVFLFSIASALVWIAWIVKVVLSRRYRPWVKPYQVGTSVIIPVVDEPLDLFRQVLSLIIEQQPTEVIVVINGRRNANLEGVCAEFPSVRMIWTPIAGKRNAVKVGVAASSQPITVLVDSDTIWTSYSDVNGYHRTLPELVKPFADPTVGGVTTRQRILNPERAWITRWADWLENTRALYAMPAQSALGQIGCLPGRTIAFRREILVRAMDDFMSERFLGVFLEVSDDRTLTNYTLKQGYRTVYQFHSLVYTDAPLQLKKLFKQQLRWARGSQYNTLRMMPWMIGHAPALAFFFALDILLPFIYVGATAGWLYRAATNTGINFYKPLTDMYPGWHGIAVVAGLIIASSWCSTLVRQSRHLADKPSDVFRLPIFIIVSTMFLMPVRIIGFVRLAHAAGWGTRKGAYAGGDSDASDGITADETQVIPPTRSAPAQTRQQPPVDAPTNPRGTPALEPSGQRTRVSLEHKDVTDLLASLDPDNDSTSPVPPAPIPSPARRGRQRARTRRGPNPYALIPYLIAAAIFAVEALAYV
jgi:hyaluronan synthase